MTCKSSFVSFQTRHCTHTGVNLLLRWIVIDGDVYDLTMFKNLHPGGAPPLKLVAGQDATEDFYSLHRKEILLESRYARLKVGTIKGYSPPLTELLEIPYAESLYMRKHSPYYKESHHKWRAVLRDFVEREILPTCADDDEEGNDISDELHRKMGEAGILAAIIGKPAKGMGVNLPAGLSFDEYD